MTTSLDIRREPTISGSQVLLFFVLGRAYPESVVVAGMVVGILLIARDLYGYWYLIDGEIKRNTKNSMESDLISLYVLVRIYKPRG